ncbi:unnamed protein product [Diamesa serratosioi]
MLFDSKLSKNRVTRTSYQDSHPGFFNVPISRVPKLQPVPRFVQTFESLTKHIPFDHHYRKKACVKSCPYDEFPNKIMTKCDYLEKRKIRKRVYMPYQVCLDDIPDEQMYGENGLLNILQESERHQSANYAVKASTTPPKLSVKDIIKSYNLKFQCKEDLVDVVFDHNSVCKHKNAALFRNII